MKSKYKILFFFLLIYLALIYGIFKIQGKTDLKMSPFMVISEEKKHFNFEAIYDPAKVVDLLTVSFKLDFVQQYYSLDLSDALLVKASSEKWERISLDYKELFNVIQFIREQSSLKVKGESVTEYTKGYKRLGYDYNLLYLTETDHLSYLGSYDLYYVNSELNYTKVSVCSIFENSDENYRVAVIFNENQTYHIIIDEHQDLIANYFYLEYEGNLEPLSLSDVKGPEEHIYGALAEMSIFNENRRNLEFNAKKYILLRQAKEIK